MAVVRKYQNNFTAGVLSPGVSARTDLGKYSAGCAELKNALVLAHGGLTKRPGTMMVDELPGGGLLIPFAYSVDQTYALCIYNYSSTKTRFRLYTSGGVVVNSSGSAYELETPYKPKDLPKIRFAQSADTLFIVHPSYPVYKLVRYSHTDWGFSVVSFIPSIKAPSGLKATASGFTDESGTYVKTTAEYIVASVDGREQESLPSGTVTANILSTWPQGAKVDLSWNAVPGAAHYEVYKNARGYFAYIGTTSKTKFTDDNIEGDDSRGPKEYRDPFCRFTAPTGITVNSSSSGTKYDVRVAHANTSGAVGVASAAVSYTGTLADMTVKIPVSSEADFYCVYYRTSPSGRWYMVTAEPGAATGTFTVKPNGLAKQNASPKDTPDNYPGAIGMFQQRLIFGRTNGEPQTVWMSETGSFDSLSVATPLRDDSAITATVDTRQMNEIRHFIPLRDMLMLTSGAEFKVSSGNSNAGAITPTTIAFPIQSYWGCSDVPPVVCGTSILMIQNSGRQVRDLAYTIQEDGYAGNELSILAEHLFDSDIVDWAAQQSPYSTVWVCLENGKLLTLTYLKEHEIFAWSEHESSGGKFLSVTSVREGAEDAVYFLVKRGSRYFVEHQIRRTYGAPAEDSFYVDCGLTYSGTPIQHVTGMTHLAGKKISVLADGSAFRDITVAADGSFDLQAPASKITAGLPYEMFVKTLDPEINSEAGNTAGDRKLLVRAVLYLRETRNFEIGPDETKLLTTKLPMQEKWDNPPVLFTGVASIPLPGIHRDEISLVVSSGDPVPCTILGLNQYISIG